MTPLQEDAMSQQMVDNRVQNQSVKQARQMRATQGEAKGQKQGKKKLDNESQKTGFFSQAPRLPSFKKKKEKSTESRR